MGRVFISGMARAVISGMARAFISGLVVGKRLRMKAYIEGSGYNDQCST